MYGRMPVKHLVGIAVVGLVLLGMLAPAAAEREPETERATQACAPYGAWFVPAEGAPASHDTLLRSIVTHAVVLLGEQHDDMAHHRWQLQMLAGLHAHRPITAIGFEMFPRSVQPALDRWVRGELDVSQLLTETDWGTVWSLPAGLYLPLFHFARDNRIPMVALNVPRGLVGRVGREGWAAVPVDAREGIGDPRPASAAYRAWLGDIYLEKRRRGIGGAPTETDAEQPTPEPEREAVLADERFGHFVDAQLTWDRAMAEALATARAAHPDPLVIGVIGRGHLDHGWGVPHQLADLGVTNVATLIPVDRAEACEAEPSVADALFVVAADRYQAAAKPRLGVFIETDEDGVRIVDVVDGSVAARAGLREGDIVLSAAGVETPRVEELKAVIERQAPGTMLPLVVRRGDRVLALIAPFPATAE